MKRLELHPDRALPADPAVREVARTVYRATGDLPLVCMHGHVEPAMLAEDRPFTDPAGMLITPDHYLTRLVHAAGVPLDALGVGPGAQQDPREIWRTFCAHWPLFRGTPTRFWLTHELVEVLGVTLTPGPDTADALFDELTERLSRPEFRPRALFERFGIEVLATTDPPLSPLTDHAKLAADGWGAKVIPTWRPDSLYHPDHPGWRHEIAQLAEVTGVDTGDYRGYVAALQHTRRRFIAAGALASDHGHLSADTTALSAAEAEQIFQAARSGAVSAADAAAFAGHMLHETARMSCEDGLVMQLHPGVLRDHHPEARRLLGPDRGFDIPVRTDFTRSLRPLLSSFGRDPRLRLIVFTVDETTYSRELAPLAGVYPAMKLGAPWWFLDSPQGLRRFREAVTETAGFANTAGFVDDTRAFCSIPARHDLARRVDAGYLAQLVAEHHLDLDEAVETAVDLAYRIPLASYRRPG